MSELEKLAEECLKRHHPVAEGCSCGWTVCSGKHVLAMFMLLLEKVNHA